MTDRDTFAAAALPLCTRNGRNAEQISESAYKLADAMLRERSRTGQAAADTTPQSRAGTNHDAVPAAIAPPSASSVPLGNGGGCGGTDKPVTLPAMGTGDLSEAEIDALEYVVEEGRIASMDDYGILRSLLVRVRPEWESQSYEESDEKRTNTAMDRDTTPSNGSVQERCTLTDDEREAILTAADLLIGSRPGATLRKLLERLHT